VFPIDTLSKEVHLLDVLQRLDPFVGVAAELLDGRLGRFRDGNFRRKYERIFPEHDFLVRLGRAFRTERRVADQHLKHDDTEGPPITGRRVTGLKNKIMDILD